MKKSTDNPSVDAAIFRRRLLRWFGRSKRDLPWRRTSDPYRIWVSEAMLQQTRVEAVIPYYQSFLREFPTVSALASAEQQKVLAAWSGLGYYSRARNLHKAAALIVARHSGKFPADEAAALSLPGVGRYTAAAVLSIAYGAPLAVVDGNVARVLSRLFALSTDVREAKHSAALWQLAGDLLDVQRPGESNQAMMELGATICVPASPDCSRCPVREHCKAYQRGVQAELPVRASRKAPNSLDLVGAIVRDRAGRYLLERRSDGYSWMQGFWQIPTWESRRTPSPSPSHHSNVREHLEIGRSLGTIRHSITKYRISVNVREATLADSRIVHQNARSLLWLARPDLKALPITTITRKAILLEQEERAAR